MIKSEAKIPMKPDKNKEVTNRLNVLYTLQVLKNYSSAGAPLSISEITDYINKDFYRTTSNEKAKINNSTVTRILDTLYSDTNLGFQNASMEFFEDPTNLGFNLYCVMRGEKNTWVTYEAPEEGKGAKKYYYFESVFSDQELITLIDAVETYNYFSTDDIAGLVAKLLSLRPKSEVLKPYYSKSDKRLKDENSLVLFNIDEFSHIIKNRQFANIVYCNYNHEHTLVPRPGYPRLIRPLSMMWSNGYYYLVALLKPGYTPANLRMDRITEIEAVEPTEEMRQNFKVDMNLETSTYRMNHPVMHGGKVQHISMLYLDLPNNGMNNAIMDTFGRTTKIRPATTEEIKKHLPHSIRTFGTNGTWYRADFSATLTGTELFATQYCRYCKIISPESLVENVSKILKTGLDLYT